VSIFLNITFGAGLAAVSPYVAFKMLTNERWRKGFSERLGKIPRREGDKPCIWIHGPSVGEILAAKPLHALIRERLPQYDIAISTTTPEGREQAAKNYGSAFLFPLDLTPFAKRALDAIRPDCIVLIERDLWPNFLSVVYRRKIPVLVANGIVSESMVKRMKFFNKLSGGLATKRLLGRISAYCVQTELYAERLAALGVAKEKICVTGNIKYDSLTASVGGEKLDSLRHALQVEERDWLIVAGSTHPGEEKVALEAFAQLRRKYDNIRLAIAPRHINRAEEVEKLVAEKGYPRIRKTAMNSGTFNRGTMRNSVLVVDTMGDLLGLYAIASAAFVG
jgi:3-deoxy-D-manno-octulosonic-acid transferase